jgi:tetratricopeptide (TPR) repeat protein
VHEGARPALDMARAMLAETRDAETSIEAGIAHRLTGASLGYVGDYIAGRPHLEKAVAILEAARLDGLITRFNDDPLIGALIRSAFDAWISGEPERSKALAERAVAEAGLHGHASTLFYVYGWKTMLEAARRDPARAKSASDAALSIAAETGVRIWVPTTTLIRLWALHELEGGAFGAETLREGLPALREVGHHVMCGPMLTVLAAEAEARAGRPDEALALVREALVENAHSGFIFLDAGLRRIAGEIHACRQQPNPAAAEEEFKRAIALARTQGARALELRAALKLAMLYQSTGRSAKAHDVLAPALEGFAPTPEMPEILEGLALLGGIAGADSA